MNIVCGTDIVEIARIKRAIERKGEKFLKKIYTENEIEYCESRKNVKYERYAGRFAGKEALYKALKSIKAENNITWKDVEIVREKTGKPKINFINKEFNEINCIDISISHCKEYAVSNVVIITK